MIDGIVVDCIVDWRNETVAKAFDDYRTNALPVDQICNDNDNDKEDGNSK